MVILQSCNMSHSHCCIYGASQDSGIFLSFFAEGDVYVRSSISQFLDVHLSNLSRAVLDGVLQKWQVHVVIEIQQARFVGEYERQAGSQLLPLGDFMNASHHEIDACVLPWNNKHDHVLHTLQCHYNAIGNARSQVISIHDTVFTMLNWINLVPAH